MLQTTLHCTRLFFRGTADGSRNIAVVQRFGDIDADGSVGVGEGGGVVREEVAVKVGDVGADEGEVDDARLAVGALGADLEDLGLVDVARGFDFVHARAEDEVVNIELTEVLSRSVVVENSVALSKD